MVECPTCGAELAAHNPGIVVAVCAYCRGVAYWDAEGLRSSGQKSMLSEGFTRLYRDATGSARGQRFRVEGRVRYSYGRGFWDEWYISFESGHQAWLTEDDHELAMQTPYEGPAAATIQPAGLQPGSTIDLEGRPFVVHEVGEARCLGIEGRLPEVVMPGETYRYADASSPDGRYALGIEVDDQPPSVFLGEWLGHDEVTLDGGGA